MLAGHERHPTESQSAEFDREGLLADPLVSNSEPGGADVASDIIDIGSLIDLTRATSLRTQRAHEIGRCFSEAISDEACNELQLPSAARAFAKWVSKHSDLHELGVAQPQCRYDSSPTLLIVVPLCQWSLLASATERLARLITAGLHR